MTRPPRDAFASDTAGFAGGLAIVAALTVLDRVVGARHGLTATVVLGPFAAGLLCSVRRTTIVGVAAIVVAVSMGLWNGNPFDPDQLIREAVVAAGSLLAILGARARADVLSLSSDLKIAERQLGVAFDSLAAAVLIQRPGKGIVYANKATAVAMGMETPEQVVAATPEQIAEGWETFDEYGVPLTPERYPSRQILTGTNMAPEPLVVRTVNRRTGKEFWRIVKASPVLSDDGELLMTVSITEDISEIKRTETAQRHIAAALQSSLLPHDLPSVAGFRTAAMYRPAGRENWVGGDFYDAFLVDDGWMVVVGDVTGSGAEAAAMTAQARHTLRAIGEQTSDHLAAITRLNRLLLAGPELSLCTVCMVKFTEDTGTHVTASIACAGHPLPFIVRNGVARNVGTPGPLVGAWDATFTSTEVDLDRDDILVLYTDGITEAPSSGEVKTRFGVNRLRETLIRATDAEDVVQRVGDALADYNTGEQADDTALVAVEYQGRPVEPTEVVLALLDAYSRDDEDAVLELMHPEIEFIPMLVATGARRAPYRGHAGILEYLRDSRAVMLDVRITVRSVHKEDDLVVVLAHVSGTAAAGPVDTPVTYVFRVRDGLVVHGVVGSDPEKARAAFGLDDHHVEIPEPIEDDETLAPLYLQMTADASSVPAIRRAVDAYAGAAGASLELREDIRLAVSEACSNAVLHAYADRDPGDPPGVVTVTAGRSGGFLHLDIEDHGRGMAARDDSPGIGVGLVVISRLATVCTITTSPNGHDGSLIHLEFELQA